LIKDTVVSVNAIVQITASTDSKPKKHTLPEQKNMRERGL